MTTRKAVAGAFEAELERFLEGDPARAGAFAEARWYGGIRRALTTLRRQAGLSQEQLAERVGCHQSEISRLENALSDRTKLGSLRRYAAGCGGTVRISLVDQQGHIIREASEGGEADLGSLPLAALESAVQSRLEHVALPRQQRREVVEAVHAALSEAVETTAGTAPDATSSG